VKIGVISDTHGFLDPRVEKIFNGVAHILHAGDIGNPVIELELKFIAPVTMVLGNNDPGLPFKETETITLAGKKFLVHHIVYPRALEENLAARIGREKPDAVVFARRSTASYFSIPATQASRNSARNAAWRSCTWREKQSGTNSFRSD